jgi:hypothetical protein
MAGDGEIADMLGLAMTYAKNKPFIKGGAESFTTPLDPSQEQQFQGWVKQNNVPFNPQQSLQDYDMRGFYQALMAKDPRAMTAINPNDSQMHYPDYWKTPYHKSFSAESQWANPQTAPAWNDKDQLVTPSGAIVFDERAKRG